jgi:hypothetical protein
MGWKYTEDHRGTGEYLNHSPELKAELLRRAHMGLAVATSLAKIGRANDPHRGALKASGRVVDDGPNRGFHRDRMQVSIVFDVPHAVPATFRNKYHSPAVEYLIAALPIMGKRGH